MKSRLVILFTSGASALVGSAVAFSALFTAPVLASVIGVSCLGLGAVCVGGGVYHSIKDFRFSNKDPS